MRRSLTAMIAGLAFLGFAGAAAAGEGGCHGLQSVQKSTPVDTAQSTPPRTPKPADDNS
jgi:hypothetical protein